MIKEYFVVMVQVMVEEFSILFHIVICIESLTKSLVERIRFLLSHISIHDTDLDLVNVYASTRSNLDEHLSVMSF